MLLKGTLFIVIGLFIDCSTAAYINEKGELEPQQKITDKEYIRLPRLEHYAEPCTPGKTFRVNCNVCTCKQNMNLWCDNKLCIDEITTRFIQVEKASGKPCTEDISVSKCIFCKCREGKTQCESKITCKTLEDYNMIPEIYNASSTRFKRLTFDFKEEECVPDVVYTDKCNKCFCQPDKTLICTRKMCLNYEQAKLLEKQRLYLEERGL